MLVKTDGEVMPKPSIAVEKIIKDYVIRSTVNCLTYDRWLKRGMEAWELYDWIQEEKFKAKLDEVAMPGTNFPVQFCDDFPVSNDSNFLLVQQRLNDLYHDFLFFVEELQIKVLDKE